MYFIELPHNKRSYFVFYINFRVIPDKLLLRVTRNKTKFLNQKGPIFLLLEKRKVKKTLTLKGELIK